LPTDLKPMVINAMVLSKASAKALLDAVRDKKIALSNINENHARSMYGLNDPELSKEVASVWGTIRTERNPERARLVDEYKKRFVAHGGDASKGQKVFEGKCAQCHTIYGHGGNIGPDITGVGRDNLDLVLSNVLDPNLVVGAPYYVHIAKLKNGTVASGLLVEESPKRVVLKDPTGTFTVPRDQLEKLTRQNISMMPEGLESTMTKDEFCDLIAFLLTKEPPK
jgi:putative heme-binding domain-containing protein